MASLFAIVRHETGASVRAAYFVEIHHYLLEPRGVAFLRPVVSPCLVPVTTDLHSLFRIRSDICRLCTTFAANPYVAAVRLGVIPCQFILRWLLAQSQQGDLMSSKIPYFDGRWQTEKVRTLIQGLSQQDPEGCLMTGAQTFLNTFSTVLDGMPWPSR